MTYQQPAARRGTYFQRVSNGLQQIAGVATEIERAASAEVDTLEQARMRLAEAEAKARQITKTLREMT